MGEKINFDFNKGKKIEENHRQEESRERLAEFSDEQRARIKEKAQPFLDFVRFVISEKGKKLKNLEISKFSYDEAKDKTKDYSNEELIGWLTNSGVEEWQKKPSFFHAIYDEMAARLPNSLKNRVKKK